MQTQSTPRLGRLARSDVVGLVHVAGGEAVNVVPEHCSLELLLEGVGAGAGGRAWRAAPLLRFHAALREMLEELRKRRDPNFDPDHSVGSLGRADLRDGVVVLEFDLRPIPGVDVDEAVAPLRELAELECLRVNPPLSTSLDSPLVRAVCAAQESLGLGRCLGTKATCTEAGVLSDSGLDALVIGPGTSVGNVHRPNEYTRVSDLERAEVLYRHVVQKFCVEEADACS